MKKMKFLTAGLIAAMMVPAAAQAQPGDLRRDRHEIRDQKRDVRPAVVHANARDAHKPRDLRDWRRDNRYQSWRAPFKYQQFRVGSTLRPTYYAPAYRLNYDSRWGLPKAGRNLAYVRHYNDLLLVNVRSGKVIKVYYNHFRWR